MSEKLNFPSFKGDPMPAPILSMEKYIEFISEKMALFTDGQKIREQLEKEKSLMTTKPFRIVD